MRCDGYYGEPPRCGLEKHHPGDCGPPLSGDPDNEKGKFYMTVMVEEPGARMGDVGRRAWDALNSAGFAKVWIKKIDT